MRTITIEYSEFGSSPNPKKLEVECPDDFADALFKRLGPLCGTSITRLHLALTEAQMLEKWRVEVLANKTLLGFKEWEENRNDFF